MTLMREVNATLFIVDDDPAARESLASLASSLRLACETYASAESFLAAFDPARSGCAIVDLQLGGLSGTQLQERLACLRAALPVILISAYATVPVAVQAMRNGAVSVVEKPIQVARLVAEIRSALEIDRRGREAHREQAELLARYQSLTPREREAMRRILEGLPNKAIARQLGVCQRTIARIRADVLKKMGAQSAVQLAARAARFPRLCDA